MADNNSVESYLQQKRTAEYKPYATPGESTFEKIAQGLATPFRIGSEALAALMLRAQDSNLSLNQAYQIAQGNRTGKEWYQSGENPATLGQALTGLLNTDNIDWRSTEDVQRYFHRDGQQLLSGGVDLAAMILLDPLNFVGGGLVSKAARLGKFGKTAETVLTADKFRNLQEFFSHAQQTLNLGPEFSSGFKIGTKEYTQSVQKMTPYFHNWDTFTSEFKVNDVQPLSDSARYMFDGSMYRAVEGDSMYTWDGIKNIWVPEQYLSPRLPIAAKGQSVPSNMSTSEIEYGLSLPAPMSPFQDITTVDGRKLSTNTYYGLVDVKGLPTVIAYDANAQKYYITTSQKIKNIAKQPKVGGLSELDVARYDMLSYKFKNDKKSFLNANDFIEEHPYFESHLDNTKANLFFFDDSSSTIYGYNSRTKKFEYIEADVPESQWKVIDKPTKEELEGPELNLESKFWTEKELQAKEDKEFLGDEEEMDYLVNRLSAEETIDDFHTRMNTSDEYLQDVSDGGSAFDGVDQGLAGVDKEVASDISGNRVSLPQTGKRKYESVVVRDRKPQWREISSQELDSIASSYQLKYIDITGKENHLAVPINYRVLSKQEIKDINNPEINLVAQEAGPNIPILIAPNGQVFGVSVTNELKPLSDVHLENQIFSNIGIRNDLEHARVLAQRVAKERQLEQDRRAIAAAPKESFDVAKEKLNKENQLKIANYEKTIEEIKSWLPDNIQELIDKDKALRESFRSIKDKPLSFWEEYAVQQYKEMQHLDSLTKILKDPESVARLDRENKFEEFMRYASKEDIRINKERSAEGKRPIQLSFWYDVSETDNGYAFKLMMRREDRSGFSDIDNTISTKDYELNTWNLTEKQYEGLKYKKNQYYKLFLLPGDAPGIDGVSLWKKTVGNSTDPSVYINIDEVDKFGLPKADTRNVKGEIKYVTTQSRGMMKRGFSAYEIAMKYLGLRLKELRKQIAVNTAAIARGNTSEKMQNTVRNWEFEMQEIVQFMNMSKEDYIMAIATGETSNFQSLRNVLQGVLKTVPKPENWLFNLEHALNQVTGENFSLHRKLQGLKDKPVEALASEEDVRLAASAQRKATAKQAREQAAVEDKKKLDEAAKRAEESVKNKTAEETTLNPTRPSTTVVRVKDVDLNDPNVQYVGRAGRGQSGEFGNPFVVGKDGTLEEVLKKYDNWLANEVKTNPEYARKVYALKGKTLACPGPESNSECHAQSIIKAIEFLDKNPKYLNDASMSAKQSTGEVIIHSGGAVGADREWAIAADKVGITTKAHSYENHSMSTDWGNAPALEERVVHTADELKEVSSLVKQAGNALGKQAGLSTEPGKLVHRNAFQVKDSEAVLCVTEGVGKTASGEATVAGRGTPWAAEMAKILKKPLFNFDQSKNAWFEWNYSTKEWDMLEGMPPKYTTFAGIGSRKLNENGRKAISDYMNQYKGNK